MYIVHKYFAASADVPVRFAVANISTVKVKPRCCKSKVNARLAGLINCDLKIYGTLV
jgi:hypothetical protein